MVAVHDPPEVLDYGTRPAQNEKIAQDERAEGKGTLSRVARMTDSQVWKGIFLRQRLA